MNRIDTLEIQYHILNSEEPRTGRDPKINARFAAA